MSFKKLKSPSSATLKKYGLTYDDWLQLLYEQEDSCPICHRVFSEKLRPVIDHRHIKRYRYLKPEIRKQQVRGLLCNYDNRRALSKTITLEKAKAIVEYLTKFENKLNK